MKDRSFSPMRLALAVAFAAALSGATNAADSNAARIGELEKRLEALQQQVVDLSAGRSASHSEGAPLHGFADVGAVRSDAPDERRRGFTVGSLGFYLTPQFGQVKTLLELVFEIEQDGSVLTDLERAQIGYTFSDALTTWVGRFHTPYGYWNTAFHHGEQIQTSASRPRFLDFEDKGGILPAHAVGTWFVGAQSLAGNRLGYDFYVANSPHIAVDDPTVTLPNTAGSLDMRMAGAEGHDPAVGFNVSLRPGALPDLSFGVHGYRAKVGDTSSSANKTRVNMAGGYAVFNDDRWELMTEYYRFRNEGLSGTSGKHASSAWYAQAGYNVADFTPYARFEKTALDQADSFFLAQESGRSYRRSLVGVRYDVTPKTAVKVEVNRTRQRDRGAGVPETDYNEARFQLATRF